jgi:hypothetical protein
MGLVPRVSSEIFGEDPMQTLVHRVITSSISQWYRRVKAQARKELEELIRYATRPPLAEKLKRILGVDLTLCPRCGGTLKSLAAITDPPSITTILRHFGLSADPPVARQRGAPTGEEPGRAVT